MKVGRILCNMIIGDAGLKKKKNVKKEEAIITEKAKGTWSEVNEQKKGSDHEHNFAWEQVLTKWKNLKYKLNTDQLPPKGAESSQTKQTGVHKTRKRFKLWTSLDQPDPRIMKSDNGMMILISSWKTSILPQSVRNKWAMFLSLSLKWDVGNVLLACRLWHCMTHQL